MIHTPAVILVVAAALAAAPVHAAPAPDDDTLRGWVEEMKASPRGPFARIRWFCKDGTVLPPEPYACRPHGGGAQHGEWTERVKALRDEGFLIANVYADLDVAALLARPDAPDALAQLLVEQYLIRVDQGWILRKARFYRGALQEEGERRGARRLLLALLGRDDWLAHRYPMVRAAARLLRHGAESRSIADMRQLSSSLAERDPGFKILRNKIHAHPDAGDRMRVADYAAANTDPALKADLDRLVAVLDEVYSDTSLVEELRGLAAPLKDTPGLAQAVAAAARRLAADPPPAERLAVTAELLATLRDQLGRPARAENRLALLDASLAVEDEHFTAGTALRPRMATAPRREQAAWLGSGVTAAYGAGLLGTRQRLALQAALAPLAGETADLGTYKDALDYLALAPGWGAQRLRFHFGAAERTLARLEPLAAVFSQDVLRGGPLLLFSQVMDHLLVDANRLAGVRHELHGDEVGAGLRALNPGLARGTLHLGLDDGAAVDPAGIYVLPETTADLPPVGGIITAGEGNPLSHVQLLARNLGIPNMAVDEALVARLRPLAGRRVMLAISPGGVIRLAEAPAAEAAAREGPADVVIRPDLDKLDLGVRELIPLSRLRADDSGRMVGPKAAKLGELHHHFPEAVADGLAIPFGVFRALLDRPLEADGQVTVYAWMVAEYRALEQLPAGSSERAARADALRERLHRWIAAADPGPDLRRQLREAMERVFGADGSYGVFVRSDTNVEDLPGFTGAGLNLTVPNVVGADNVLAAIPRVWASPFTARAFAWRQSHMDRPEHVYPAVLLLRSVDADKSGVMVTRDVDTGSPDWLTVAVNAGVGGAVDGQAAESLRIHVKTGEVRLMAEATATERRAVDPAGGVSRHRVEGIRPILAPAEIDQLVALARTLPERFPAIVDEDGRPAPADIEFGFEDGELRLFQIRPFLESRSARASTLLAELDAPLRGLADTTVNLAAPPGGPP